MGLIMDWAKLWAEAGPLIGSILAFTGIAGLKLLKDKVEKAREKSRSKETRGLMESLILDTRISEFITELRVTLGADRTHFDQPHNGSHFASMFPMYKLSRTHESCRLGVPYFRIPTSQVRVSEITALLGPVLLGNPNPGQENLCWENDPGHRVIGTQVDQMEPVYERFFLESQAVKYQLTTGIWVEGDLYGFVSADFCDDEKWVAHEFRCEAAQTLRDAAEKIGFVIREGRKNITGG